MPFPLGRHHGGVGEKALEDARVLSEAIIVWTGWGDTPTPERDEQRLISRYGPEATLDLLPRLRRIEEEFYASDASFTAADLKDMGDVAAAQFHVMHPEITPDAVEALAWCYTWDFK